MRSCELWVKRTKIYPEYRLSLWMEVAERCHTSKR